MTQENDELDNEERMFLIKDSLDRIFGMKKKY